MFRSARLKLTAWYLLIIMLISGFFSLIIYNRVVSQLEIGFNQIELRIRHMMPGVNPVAELLLAEQLKTAKSRVLFVLFSANGIILILSATAGYFLAGRTLKPIEETLKEQKRFVADASHELRTPLTALKTTLEVALRDKNLSVKEAKKVLKESLEETDSLQVLTDNLLTLAQHQQKIESASFEPLNAQETVQRALRKISPLAKKKRIDLYFKAEDFQVEADKESLEKLLVILLDNATKYTPKGGRVSLIAKPDRNVAVFEVKDTGIGIAQEDIPHIFDRFYRVDESRTKTTAPGYGLGLSMAKKIVDLHQGTIEAASAVGAGTTFTIRLPLKLA